MQVHAQEPKMKPDEARQALAIYRVEGWYEAIRQWTFATQIVPLQLEEARALTKFRERQRMFVQYQRRLGHHDFDKAETTKIKETIMAELSAEQRQSLLDLTTRLDAAIKSYVASSGGAFVKLSTRSPKDAALSSETIKSLIRADIAASKLPPHSQEAEIADMISFTRNCSRALRVTDGTEALELLLSSQRTFNDLLLCELMQTASKWDMQVIVREWQDIAVEWEFRAFVFNHSMTAITQYYPLCFVPQFREQKKEITDCIVNFWKSHLRELPYFQEVKHYTIDFVLSPDLKSVKVIEVNNPPPVAGTSLFDWDSPDDRRVVHEGPLQLRVLESPLSQPKDKIHPPLKELINNLRGIETPVSHTKVRCNACHVQPITREWYVCRTCGDFDMCRTCFDSRKEHPHALSKKLSHDMTDPLANITPVEDSAHGCTLC